MKIKFGPVAKFDSLPGDNLKGIIMKEVVSLIDKVVKEKEIDRHQGLNAVLDFLIDIFDIKHWKEPEGWFKAVAKAEKEEPYLYRIMMIWMDKVATAMENGSWLDFFGGIYEEMFQSKRKASTLGQFFTPPNICDLLAKVSQPTEGKINDCACGSGRTLLAGASAAGFPRDNYYIGEDLDIVSVKMCALNLMIHGCKGEVVRHDTLKNPIMFDYGFRINDIRYPIPTPFYSLTRIKLTKEEVEHKSERIRERHGEHVKVTQDRGGEVIEPNKLFKKKEELKRECVQSYTQLSIFD